MIGPAQQSSRRVNMVQLLPLVTQPERRRLSANVTRADIMDDMWTNWRGAAASASSEPAGSLHVQRRRHAGQSAGESALAGRHGWRASERGATSPAAVVARLRRSRHPNASCSVLSNSPVAFGWPAASPPLGTSHG